MSYFASALNELLEGNGGGKIRQAEVSRRAGIPQPHISRWINDQQEWISDVDFKRLCKFFTKPDDQAQLMRARLLDMLAAANVEGTKLITVSITGATPSKEDPRPEHKLAPKQDRDLQTIREHLPHNRLIRNIIANLAAHLRGRK